MPINVGGDDSVIWKVRAKNAKHAMSDPDVSSGKKEFYHEGVDDNGASGVFTIVMKLPVTSGAPLPTVQNLPSAQVTQTGADVWLTVRLPIEPSNGKKGKDKKDPDQISIDW